MDSSSSKSNSNLTTSKFVHNVPVKNLPTSPDGINPNDYKTPFPFGNHLCDDDYLEFSNDSSFYQSDSQIPKKVSFIESGSARKVMKTSKSTSFDEIAVQYYYQKLNKLIDQLFDF